MKSTRRMPFLSQKADGMNFFTEIKILNFLVLGELLLGFGSLVKTPCFISSHNLVQKLIAFLCVAREKLQPGTHPFRFVIVH